ncbi:hypothetical protein T03_5050 [Trichinella britovi]|uniref:Uncharacterized protein n=1 Tax=Trichinella britovi TaxID=45882 RepID=A0A0V1DIE7_TRIBR|nr:hypothetical protein T03_5050 [Trichinella britovi]
MNDDQIYIACCFIGKKMSTTLKLLLANPKVRISRTSFLRTNIQNVVSANKRIAVFLFQLAIGVLFCLLQSDVQVSIQTSQNATII